MTASTTSPVFSLHRGSLPLADFDPASGHANSRRHRRDDDAGRARTDDCDWHLDRLYAFAKRMGASILVPTYARYVIDLNRPPDGANLYPGQDTTGLLPVDTFDKEPLYLDGCLPDEARSRAASRCVLEALSRRAGGRTGRAEGEARQGAAVGSAFDSLARAAFFRRTLAGFQLRHVEWRERGGGIGRGARRDVVGRHGGYTAVANGRFKGGYITRHYGQPSQERARGAARVVADYVYGRAAAVCV